MMAPRWEEPKDAMAKSKPSEHGFVHLPSSIYVSNDPQRLSNGVRWMM